MSILDKLSTLLKAEFKFPKLSSIAIHIFHDFKINKIIHIEQNNDNRHYTVNINVAKVNKEELPQLKRIIRESVEQEDNLLLEDNAKLLLDNFKDEEQNNEYIEVIDFFKQKIPPTDLEILRAALYIKSLYDKGLPVRELKSDIIYKYGDKGRNIVNLCSAGYFTSYIKPLYLEMQSQETFIQDDFLDVYKTIIKHSAFAIFVNSGMTEEELISNIESQMEFNKKYGITHLNIHGIGETNIKKIQDALTKIKEKLTSIPEIESTRKYISVTIFF